MSEHGYPTREIAGLQVLRAIAAVAVVVHHTMEEAGGAARQQFPDWLTTAGAAGVDVFFVISGFIMLATTFDFRSAPPTPATFLWKRLTRIYPFYWLCLGGMLSIMALGFLNGMPRDVGFLFRSILLLPAPRYLIGVAWTLSYEMLFYLIFATALGSRSRTQTALMTAASIVALVSGVSIGFGPGELRDFLKNPIMFEFCFGLALAWALKGRSTGAPVWVGITGGLAVCLASAVVHHESTNGLTDAGRVIGWGVPSAFTVWSGLRFRQVTSSLGKFGVRLGNASYALYLTHPFVMIAYAYLLKHTALRSVDQNFIVASVVIIAVFVGITAHSLVEQPLLTIISRTLKRPVGAASPAEELQPG